MQVFDILVLAIILAICGQFWQLRKQAETADTLARNYCSSNNVQFISCARVSTSLKFFKHNLAVWHSQYHFEFSGNGEDKSQGKITLENHKLLDITAEAYRI